MRRLHFKKIVSPALVKATGVASFLYVCVIFFLSSLQGVHLGAEYISYIVHFIEYFGFAFLLSISLTYRYEGLYPYVVLSIAAAIAAADELYQSMVPTRTSSLLDFLVDLLGIITAIIFFGLLFGDIKWKKAE